MSFFPFSSAFPLWSLFKYLCTPYTIIFWALLFSLGAITSVYNLAITTMPTKSMSSPDSSMLGTYQRHICVQSLVQWSIL